MRRWNEALVTNMLPEHVAKHFLGTKKRDEVNMSVCQLKASFSNVGVWRGVSIEKENDVKRHHAFHSQSQFQLTPSSEAHDPDFKCSSFYINAILWFMSLLHLHAPLVYSNTQLWWNVCWWNMQTEIMTTSHHMLSFAGAVQPVIWWNRCDVCFYPQLFWFLHWREHQQWRPWVSQDSQWDNLRLWQCEFWMCFYNKLYMLRTYSLIGANNLQRFDMSVQLHWANWCPLSSPVTRQRWVSLHH